MRTTPSRNPLSEGINSRVDCEIYKIVCFSLIGVIVGVFIIYLLKLYQKKKVKKQYAKVYKKTASRSGDRSVTSIALHPTKSRGDLSLGVVNNACDLHEEHERLLSTISIMSDESNRTIIAHYSRVDGCYVTSAESFIVHSDSCKDVKVNIDGEGDSCTDVKMNIDEEGNSCTDVKVNIDEEGPSCTDVKVDLNIDREHNSGGDIISKPSFIMLSSASNPNIFSLLQGSSSLHNDTTQLETPEEIKDRQCNFKRWLGDYEKTTGEASPISKLSPQRKREMGIGYLVEDVQENLPQIASIKIPSVEKISLPQDENTNDKEATIEHYSRVDACYVTSAKSSIILSDSCTGVKVNIDGEGDSCTGVKVNIDGESDSCTDVKMNIDEEGDSSREVTMNIDEEGDSSREVTMNIDEEDDSSKEVRENMDEEGNSCTDVKVNLNIDREHNSSGDIISNPSFIMLSSGSKPHIFSLLQGNSSIDNDTRQVQTAEKIKDRQCNFKRWLGDYEKTTGEVSPISKLSPQRKREMGIGYLVEDVQDNLPQMASIKIPSVENISLPQKENTNDEEAKESRVERKVLPSIKDRINSFLSKSSSSTTSYDNALQKEQCSGTSQGVKKRVEKFNNSELVLLPCISITGTHEELEKAYRAGEVVQSILRVNSRVECKIETNINNPLNKDTMEDRTSINSVDEVQRTKDDKPIVLDRFPLVQHREKSIMRDRFPLVEHGDKNNVAAIKKPSLLCLSGKVKNTKQQLMTTEAGETKNEVHIAPANNRSAILAQLMNSTKKKVTSDNQDWKNVKCSMKSNMSEEDYNNFKESLESRIGAEGPSRERNAGDTDEESGSDSDDS